MLAIGLFVVLIPLTIGAWLVFFLCWQGRAIQIPASCAACQHPTGDSPLLSASTCVECGADLSGTRAICYFKRERTSIMKVGLIAASIAITVTSILPLAAAIAVLFIGISRQVTVATPPASPSVSVSPVEPADREGATSATSDGASPTTTAKGAP